MLDTKHLGFATYGNAVTPVALAVAPVSIYSVEMLCVLTVF